MQPKPIVRVLGIVVALALVLQVVMLCWLTGRHVSLDEAMLLANLDASSWNGFISTLPLYDQQSPAPLALMTLKLLNAMSMGQVIVFRLLLWLLIWLPLAVLFRRQQSFLEWPFLFPAGLLALTSSLAISFYATAISPYSFDILALTLVLTWFLRALAQPARLTAPISWLLLLGGLGFSYTSLLFLPACLFLLLLNIRYNLRPSRQQKGLLVSVVGIIIACIFYGRGVPHWLLQPSDAQQLHTGIRDLSHAIVQDRPASLPYIAAMVLSTLGCLFWVKAREARVLAVVTLASMGFMLAVRHQPYAHITGIGQLAWLLPAGSFLVAAFLILPPAVAPRLVAGLKGVVSLSLLAALGISVWQAVARDDAVHYRALYRDLANQPAATVWVWPWGQPMLNYYQPRLAGLKQHHYIELPDVKSGAATTQSNSWQPLQAMHKKQDYQWFVNHVFVESLPRSQPFLMLLAPMDKMAERNVTQAAQRYGCQMQPISQRQGGQLLSMYCY